MDHKVVGKGSRRCEQLRDPEFAEKVEDVVGLYLSGIESCPSQIAGSIASEARNRKASFKSVNEVLSSHAVSTKACAFAWGAF